MILGIDFSQLSAREIIVIAVILAFVLFSLLWRKRQKFPDFYDLCAAIGWGQSVVWGVVSLIHLGWNWLPVGTDSNLIIAFGGVAFIWFAVQTLVKLLE